MLKLIEENTEENLYDLGQAKTSQLWRQNYKSKNGQIGFHRNLKLLLFR